MEPGNTYFTVTQLHDEDHTKDITLFERGMSDTEIVCILMECRFE